MSKSSNLHPEQEPLFNPDGVVHPANIDDLTPEQSAEYDRLDAQGRLSPSQIRKQIGASALEISDEPISWTEESDLIGPDGEHLVYEVFPPQPNYSENRKPRKKPDRRRLSGRGKLLADEPPGGYQEHYKDS